jgi:hypothetical protein
MAARDRTSIMKRPWLYAAGAFLTVAVARTLAALPQLASGVVISNGLAPLNMGIDSAPTVADWNGDGKKDLLLGQFTNGYIYLFLNQAASSNSLPVLNGASLIQSSGTALTTSWG